MGWTIRNLTVRILQMWIVLGTPSCMCLYIIVVYIVYHLGSRYRHWYVYSIVQCYMFYTFLMYVPLPPMLYLQCMEVFLGIMMNFIYMDKLGERIKTRAVFHHVKLCCGPSTQWLTLFFMEQPRYWKNILTGEDRPRMQGHVLKDSPAINFIILHH